jgi:hypothetical protein
MIIAARTLLRTLVDISFPPDDVDLSRTLMNSQGIARLGRALSVSIPRQLPANVGRIDRETCRFGIVRPYHLAQAKVYTEGVRTSGPRSAISGWMDTNILTSLLICLANSQTRRRGSM